MIHHFDHFTREQLEEVFDLDLSRVRFRQVPKPDAPGDARPNSLRSLRHRLQTNAEQAAWSRPYDLFILSGGDSVPFPCHARRGLAIVYFPLEGPEEFFGYVFENWKRLSPLRRGVARVCHSLDWMQRFRSYQQIVAISSFTQYWIQRRWRAESTIVYPPARTDFTPVPKQPLILSVGRFNGEKRIDVLIESFRALCDGGLQGWRYMLVGGLPDDPAAQARLDALRRAASGLPIEFAVNLSGAELKSLYESASIFWHARGYGVDAMSYPEEMEHFGIVNVEAMAAGCVPIIFHGGGHPEIVQDGVDGFLWNHPSELIDRTRLVIDDPARVAAMSQQAVAHAARFSKAAFIDRFLHVTAPLLEPGRNRVPAHVAEEVSGVRG